MCQPSPRRRGPTCPRTAACSCCAPRWCGPPPPGTPGSCTPTPGPCAAGTSLKYFSVSTKYFYYNQYWNNNEILSFNSCAHLLTRGTCLIDKLWQLIKTNENISGALVCCWGALWNILFSSFWSLQEVQVLIVRSVAAAAAGKPHCHSATQTFHYTQPEHILVKIQSINNIVLDSLWPRKYMLAV